MATIVYQSDKEVTNTEIGTKSRIDAVMTQTMLRLFWKEYVRRWNLGQEKWLEGASRTLVGHSSRSLEDNSAESNVDTEA